MDGSLILREQTDAEQLNYHYDSASKLVSLGYKVSTSSDPNDILTKNPYHTLGPDGNRINGISPFNVNLETYMAAGRGALNYAYNQVSNEYLYWTGR
ncbi:hypothetical protein LJC64_03165 [Ruminococcaceae bacterium OttesenSCG-928-A11]|nr:hypothetical protein [Ruminococcaceae bacterium OttesenSCG-928-A11]